ncbi:MAG: calcium-binding protein, partial [Pseudomonadota bacterium]|nr:calcium-binding protein [Pseudomonadota bacterium]
MTVTSVSGADMVALSSAFGRETGSGILSASDTASIYDWVTPSGIAAQARGAPGALQVAPDGAPSGPVARLDLGLDDGGVLALAPVRVGDALGDLGFFAAEGAVTGAFDDALAGADLFDAGGPGDARLFGDALIAANDAAGGADLFNLFDDGARMATGDFWIVPEYVFAVSGGGDELLILSRGDLHVWGDAPLLRARASADGGGFAGGSDRLDASGAVAPGEGGAPEAVLIGDVGAVGANWEMIGGDDALLAPAYGGALAGDALGAGAGARLVGGDDLLTGGAGADVLFGDAQDLAGPVDFAPGADTLLGGAGDDVIWGDARSVDAEVLAASDSLAPLTGGDLILCGEGDDTADGGWGDDEIEGEAGDDRLAGGEGDDQLSGGAGRDRLGGAAGADRLEGGGGA